MNKKKSHTCTWLAHHLISNTKSKDMANMAVPSQAMSITHYTVTLKSLR